jgi:DNA topoisomerase-1
MSDKTLIIVESPGKIKKISEILGSNYIVKASFGHIMDLDKKTLSIDVNNNFEPYYVTNPDKLKVVKELKSLTKECKEVIIASDEDREGEMIAHSLAVTLGLKNPKRIVFHEITKNAIMNAISSPKTINNNMVNAQQARRLLDRLVGYNISPILWKYLDSSSQSAGRVQSVVLRIMCDKENDINNAIMSPFFKTTAEFKYKKHKLNSVLMKNDKHYHFENEDKVKEFLNKIMPCSNSKNICKVNNIVNTNSIRKPSQPFITSTLQQEASSKLHYNVKKTMDIAQKLYEAGHITYMRTDSPNISKETIEEIKKYVEEKYGKEYSDPKNYKSKNSNAQEAHECIRPTIITNDNIENMDKDCMKIYNLIWKRTIASQMSNAKINIMTIYIDILNSQNISILSYIKAYFVSTLENIEFPGYTIVYDNNDKDEEDEHKSDKLEIAANQKINDILNFGKLKISEEYTKPPLRYNEALLIKYLEKNGIGRPSTYASIINKVIERQYIEINNVDGYKKNSKVIEIDAKYKMTENIKEIIIGKEMKKLIPTENGKKVNDFMMKNFTDIMDIEFTSNFETYLDKIAEGNANWITILRNFYDMFNPIVEKLNKNFKSSNNIKDRLLGKNSEGMEIYCGKGKFGPYVKIQSVDDKWKYSSLKDITIEDITLEDALKCLEFPKTLGKIGNAIVTLNEGKYGLYLKCNGKNYSVKTNDNITIETAKNIINNFNTSSNSSNKSFKLKNKIVNIKSGEFGNYIQLVEGQKTQNIGIPKNIDINDLTEEDIVKMIANKNGTFKKNI